MSEGKEGRRRERERGRTNPSRSALNARPRAYSADRARGGSTGSSLRRTSVVVELQSKGIKRTKERRTYLERWEHLALFLPVQEAVIILHGYERGEVVREGVVLHLVDW